MPSFPVGFDTMIERWEKTCNNDAKGVPSVTSTVCSTNARFRDTREGTNAAVPATVCLRRHAFRIREVVKAAIPGRRTPEGFAGAAARAPDRTRWGPLSPRRAHGIPQTRAVPLR